MSTATTAPVKAPWHNWWYEKFQSWFHHNGATLLFSEDVPKDALGTWKWEQECSCKPERLVLTMNSGGSGLWGLPDPKHHAPWGREAAIAHMVLHIEDGTHCVGADPQDWDTYERDVDMRAMARMGWTSWISLRLWDEKLQKMVDIDPATGRPTEPAHVVKKPVRRRRTPTAARATVGRR